ncbi:hypothetical protein E4U55_008190 [Claviceps digitariae]|nr:hypothetical protein E4U55_008190 [Claviceps digitariae]
MRLQQPIEKSSDDAYIAHSSSGGGGGGADDGAVIAVQHDQLDDVFGSAPASPTETDSHNDSHPSDMPRLQTEHTTAGYREGITVAKESSIQAGFDEGFSLGAALGSQAGQLLGLVEGIADALKTHTAETAETSTQLLRDATRELSTDSIFSPEYWASDGNWTYEVVAAAHHDDGAAGEQMIVFSDVANAHPLIRKWRGIVDEQLRVWRVRRLLLEEEETGPRLETAAVGAGEAVNSSAAPRGKQALDW